MESRARIVSSAVRLFARRGYAGTGLRELARTADVNLAMINYFFGTKQGLLREILDDFLSGYLAVARETLPGAGDPQEKIHRFIVAAVTYFSSRQDALIVTITELPHDDPEIIAYKATWGRKMMEIIDREICLPFVDAAGSRLPAALIGPMLISMMASRFLFAPVMEHVQTPQNRMPDCTEYADMVSDLVLRGISGRSVNSAKEE